MEIKDYVKQFLETYGTSGKAERVTVSSQFLPYCA